MWAIQEYTARSGMVRARSKSPSSWGRVWLVHHYAQLEGTHFLDRQQINVVFPCVVLLPAWVLISKPPWTQHSMLLCKVLMNCPIRQPCFCSRLQRTRLKYNSQLFPSSRALASAPQWPQLSYKYSKRQSLWQLLKCSFQLVTKMRMIILIVLKTDPHVAEKPWATLRNV